MPDIYFDDVARRTWEYAGSHKSNVVCVWVIFSLVPDTVYILKDVSMA